MRGPPAWTRLACALAALAQALAGCDGPPEAPEGAAYPGCELGTGTEAFVPVEDGDVLQVERGPQGGVHVRGSVRAWGVDPGTEDEVDAWYAQDRPEIEFQLGTAEGLLSLENVLRRPLLPLGDGTTGHLGAIVQFDYWVELPEDWTEIDWAEEELRLETVDMELSVRVTDHEGVEVRDARAIRVDFPPRPDDDGPVGRL